MATDNRKDTTDNSFMFVDEDVEDISKAAHKTKGRFLDETISGEIAEDSTINLVADEDVSKQINKSAFSAKSDTKEQLSFQEKLERRAEDLSHSLDDTLERRREERSREEVNSVALNNERIVAKGKGFGVASLICGILSITFFVSFINIFTSILGIAFGLVQIRRGTAKGISITGIILSICSVILMIVCINILTTNQAFVDMLLNNFGSIANSIVI